MTKIYKEMLMLLQVIKWTGYSLAGLIFLVITCFLLYKTYLKFSTTIRAPNGISSLEEVTLGGLKQWVFLRGVDQNNPVLVFLHGGPGEPALGISSSRNLDAELISHFTVVHWDQLGAGKSYKKDIPIKSMSIDQWIKDCNELINYLLVRFNTQKVFLVAHSGGTSLGLKIAHYYPEKIHAYVSIAQVINNFEQHKISYEFLLEKAKNSGNAKFQKALNAIGPPPYLTPKKEFQKARHIIKYGGFIHDNPMKHLGFIMLSYLTSPEYSFLDAIKTIRGKGLKFTMDARYKEIENINFTEEVKSLKVPVYFFIGKYDRITPAVQVENFHHTLDAKKGNKLIFFDNSAHLPIVEEPEKYRDLLINLVLKETQTKK